MVGITSPRRLDLEVAFRTSTSTLTLTHGESKNYFYQILFRNFEFQNGEPRPQCMDMSATDVSKYRTFHNYGTSFQRLFVHLSFNNFCGRRRRGRGLGGPAMIGQGPSRGHKNWKFMGPATAPAAKIENVRRVRHPFRARFCTNLMLASIDADFELALTFVSNSI